MTDRMPDNLAAVSAAFGEEAIGSLFTGETFEFGGVEFVCKYAPDSTADRFFILKPPDFVDYFVDFCAEFRDGNIFELGIAEGGSAALVALVAEPAKLVAIDLETEPLTALHEFAAARSLTDVVRPFYGIDQADRAAVTEISDAEFGFEPIDWVLDDASHQLDLTRASFDMLFPRLRPGGAYTIEDWNGSHIFRDAIASALRSPSAPQHEEARKALLEAAAAASPEDEPEPPPESPPPLSQLAVELLLACASAPDVIAQVSVNEYWIEVRRGPAPVEVDAFALTDLFTDYFGYLPTAPSNDDDES